MQTTVHVAIGNSDDRLTQAQWADYYRQVDDAIRLHAVTVHGAWVSPSTLRWQNACWAVAAAGLDRTALRVTLRLIADRFDQESVAWNESVTEFLPGASYVSHLTRTAALADEANARQEDVLFPATWCEILGVHVADPDGWRGSAGRPWTDPITVEEFERRSAVSTVNMITPRGRHNGWDSECSGRDPLAASHPLAKCHPCRNIDPRQTMGRVIP